MNATSFIASPLLHLKLRPDFQDSLTQGIRVFLNFTISIETLSFILFLVFIVIDLHLPLFFQNDKELKNFNHHRFHTAIYPTTSTAWTLHLTLSEKILAIAIPLLVRG